MNPFFGYLIKSSVCLIVFYASFKATMSRDKNHRFNRILLLAILFASAIIPALNLRFFETEPTIIQPIETFREFISMPAEPATIPSLEIAATAPVPEAGLPIDPWKVVYFLAITALLTRLALSVAKIARMIRKSEKKTCHSFILALIKETIQPFSFLKYILISETDYHKSGEMIVTHEQAHIRLRHSADLFISEVFTLIFWFNPFVWLLKRDLKLIHEFQADQAVLDKNIDAKQYQLLVLEKAVGERRFALANLFIQKPISKRIKMMKKKKMNRWAGIKLILFLPLGLLLLQAFSRPEIITVSNDFISGIIENPSKQSSASLEISLNQGGKITVKEKDYNILEFKEYLSKTVAATNEDSLIVYVKIGIGVTSKELVRLKQVLENEKKVYAYNSTDYKESEWPPNKKDNQTKLTEFVVKVTASKILIDDVPVTKKQLDDRAIDFLLKSGKNYNVTIYTEPGVTEERKKEIKEFLFFDGMAPSKMKYLTFNSDEIVYQAGDVSVPAKFTQGEWNEWLKSQLKEILKDCDTNSEFVIEYGFIIDKNGKIRDGQLILPSRIPDVNEAFKQILSQIPDWQPALKGQNHVNVFYQEGFVKKDFKERIKAN